jgi:uncharacterized protein (DUF433 family)
LRFQIVGSLPGGDDYKRIFPCFLGGLVSRLVSSLRGARIGICALTFAHPASNLATMDYRKYITLEPGKRGGKACIRGLRITVYEVLDYLASGMSEDEILRDFPDLSREDIRACLAFAADRERKLATIPE